MGHSSRSGASYLWSGSRGFAFSAQNPKTASNGLYNIPVTNPVNGCTLSTNITLSLDTVSANGVKASVSGVISCENTKVTLTGNSNTTGVIYKWTGPDGFSSENQNPVVSVPGNYILRITKPDNNCSVYRTVEVLQNKSVPEVVAGISINFLHNTSKKLAFSTKLQFINFCIASTAWFLIRAIPKPFRASYPCMRAAAPFASAFVFVLGITNVSRIQF